MSRKYRYETREFGIAGSAIHLLRSGFSYKTIPFSKIQRIWIKDARELDNWWVILIIGLLLTLPGVYVSINIITSFLRSDVSASHGRLMLLLLIPVVGLYFIYSSLRTGPMMEICMDDGNMVRLPLSELEKRGLLVRFQDFIRSELGSAMQECAEVRQKYQSSKQLPSKS